MAHRNHLPVIIVYQGPPRWDGTEWINGDKFFISGDKFNHRNLGVELANSIDGLEFPTREFRYDTDANTPGSRFVSSVATRRSLKCSVNIFGDSVEEMRKAKDRWFLNHPEGSPGRLWFFTNTGEHRYLSAYAAENAGSATYDKDPGLRGVTTLEWGWTSDSPYFYGFREKKLLKPKGGGVYEGYFYNPSTAPQVFPEVFLPGFGQWELSLGYEQPTFRTPNLADGDVAKLDYDQKALSFTCKRKDGRIENLWPSMVGNRPMYCLEPQTINKVTIRNLNEVGNDRPKSKWPYLSFTPEYISWT